MKKFLRLINNGNFLLANFKRTDRIFRAFWLLPAFFRNQLIDGYVSAKKGNGLSEITPERMTLFLTNECNMKCHYCACETYLLYEIVRENKQWSLDRINNDIGHNRNNLLIACLECNLKRRRTNKDAFMFTKNLKIVRLD